MSERTRYRNAAQEISVRALLKAGVDEVARLQRIAIRNERDKTSIPRRFCGSCSPFFRHFVEN